MYSWTTVIRSANEHPREYIRPGDEVSASDFENEEDYNELVDIGAFREQPYPIPKNKDGSFVHEGSPREYALAQIAAMSQDDYDAAVVNTWSIPHLQDKAQEAMDETDYHPELPSEEQVAAQDKAEQGQESRQALEGQAGKTGVKGAASVDPNKATAGKK